MHLLAALLSSTLTVRPKIQLGKAALNHVGFLTDVRCSRGWLKLPDACKLERLLSRCMQLLQASTTRA